MVFNNNTKQEKITCSESIKTDTCGASPVGAEFKKHGIKSKPLFPTWLYLKVRFFLQLFRKKKYFLGLMPP